MDISQYIPSEGKTQKPENIWQKKPGFLIEMFVKQ